MKIQKIISSLLFVFAALNTAAADRMEQAIAELKILNQMKVYSYDYTVKNTYPNGTSDLATGNVSIDLLQQALFEKGTYSTTMLTNKWYYKAEHADKTVQLINLEHYYKKNSNAIQLSAFFDTKTMMIPDSIFRQYGSLERFEVKNDLVSIRIKFNDLMNIDTYEVSFDRKKAIPIAIFIKLYAPTAQGITYQEFKGLHFKKQLPPDRFATMPFFEIKGEKVTLKMYNNYKPHFEL